MEEFLIFLTVFVTLISSACTAFLMPIRQRGFAAKGIAMLVLNIVGYALAVFNCAIVPTLYYRVGIDTDVLFLFPLGVAVLFVIAVVVTEFVCRAIARKRQQEEADEELFVEEPKTEE